jgi:hypothetical protein
MFGGFELDAETGTGIPVEGLRREEDSSLIPSLPSHPTLVSPPFFNIGRLGS